MGIGIVCMRAGKMFENFRKQEPWSDRFAKIDLASGKGVSRSSSLGIRFWIVGYP